MDRNRIDSEYLIEAIRKHPSIWNKDSKAYHNKGFKENSWANVGEELVDNWNSLSEDEKLVKLYDFKKRWGNIRDYYKKDLALQVSGRIGTTSKRKKYVFSKQLEFLKPFFVNKSDKSCKEETEDGEAEESQCLEVIYSSDSESSFPLRRKNAVKIEEKSNPDETVKENDLDGSDSDLLFLKSLVPDMRAMTREEKIDFKMGILQLYKNIMNEDWSFGNLEKKIESELLIEAIKKHDCIWNKDSKNYHRKNRKENSWNQVCEALMENWNSFNEEEKFNRKNELKKRWSNIRDYYKKDVALQLSGKIGQPAMKRQKYVFSQQLEFLRPFFDKSFTYGSLEHEDQAQEEQEVYLEPCSSDTESSLPLKRAHQNSDEIRTLEVTPMVSKTETESYEDDSDYMFLKSIVPDMKAMSREQKVDFKMGILQLYKNIMSERRYFNVNYGSSLDTKNPLQ